MYEVVCNANQFGLYDYKMEITSNLLNRGT